MRIRAKSDFLDGRYRFLEAQQYEVPDRRGGGYTANGWADELPDDDAEPFTTVTMAELTADAPRPAEAEVTLVVQDVVHTATSEI